MHIIVYKFNVLPNKKDEFIHAWRDVTENIYKERGSLGSRLHQSSVGEYIAYAQWPSIDQVNKDIESSEKFKNDFERMRNCLESSEVLYELDVIEDLLKN